MLLPSIVARAQALPTATGRGALQVGGGWTLAVPDYGQKNIQGITAYGDFDFTQHLGVEATLHYVSFITPTDLGENTYLVGPRYVFHNKRFSPYAKALIGRADLVVQEKEDNPDKFTGTYFGFALGGGLDISMPHHLVLRAIDAEYQRWPGLGNGLSPYVFTVGVAYKFR